MTTNRAVIYSNGIADFRRNYQVEGWVQIAIPVKQEHVADVLASLHVLGDVRLSSPPTFRPANESEGSLRLDPSNVLVGLAASLGGAEVEIQRPGASIRGLMTGVHVHKESNGGAAYDVYSLIVLSEGSLRRVPVNDVESLRFADEVVQAEIDKALQRQVQRIKPNSTFVELELSSESSAEALVQYTVPAAAWKITYRLRALADEKFELQGYAVVDNNTDEDWRDFQLAVVTGEPITFSTDLADSKTPHRKHVNIVRDEALGAVEPEVVIAMSAAPSDEGLRARKSARAYQTSGGLHMDESLERMEYASASIEAAKVEESGDFCVYEAQTPVSIDSNRSAVIPVFQVALAKSQSVLHFKEANHATRPFRAIQFVNETGHSLGRGVCTVFESGVYGGSCVMPANKPNDESLLPHALETGVLTRVEHKQRKHRRMGLKIADGVVHQQMAARQTTIYRIASSRDDSALLFLDHTYQLADRNIEATASVGDESVSLATDESLSDGVRLRFDIPARETMQITVVETNIQAAEVIIAGENGSHNLRWLTQNVVQANGPLSDNEAIANCVAIQEEIDAKAREISTARQEMQQLTDRQERLRKNVAAGANAQHATQWLAALAKAEERLVELEEQTIPSLERETQAIEAKLHSALKALNATWEGEAVGW